MMRTFSRFVATLVLFGLFSVTAHADENANSQTAIEPKADETFKRMSDYLGAIRNLSFKAADTVDEVLESGHRIQLASTRSILIRRPNRIYAEYIGDGIDRKTWFDGETVTVLDVLTKEYGQIETPGTIDEMLDFAAENFQITLPLADLMFSSVYDAVHAGIQSGRYLGVHKVHDVDCHHLTFQSGAVAWQIWIETGDRPLPRKLVITYGNIPTVPQFVAYLYDWNLSADTPDSAFEFSAPQDVKKIEFKPLVERRATDGK